MMTYRIAIAGLRHNHVFAAIRAAEERPGVEVVACAEDHAPTRESLRDRIRFTHDDTLAMIRDVDCDIVLVGDYFARRGSLLIEALRRGRHVLADKPIATSLDEVDAIADLAGRGRLAVGCQFDLPSSPNIVRLRELVRGGALGEIHQIAFGGQHPLSLRERPPWYFEPGKHGGTINDIGIHAVHLIPWLTGLTIDRVVAARTWNAFATHAPAFNDSAQLMLVLSNGAGVLGDVSYAMPDGLGPKLPQYWRLTLYGSEGIAETSVKAPGVMYAPKLGADVELLPGTNPTEPHYFDSFLREVAGEGAPAGFTTADILRAARQALEIQRIADASPDASLAR